MENKNGQGIFYGVIGVATLVVAIIGATFAYFSASATSNGDTIEGDTNGNLSANLSLAVAKVNYTFTGEGTDKSPASPNLVPAVLDSTTPAGITKALAAKCVNDGYTGCHVYSLTSRSTAAVTTANLKLTMTVDAETKTNWKYVVYEGSQSAATAIRGSGTIPTTDTSIALVDGLAASTDKVYYLLVYLENVDSTQNAASGGTGTSETGHYSGTVTLEAAGGHVKADFSA